ncbi:hypothetical protein KSP40_PGU013516 [Platanthera guangdongensis]|uniref:Tf2-1-like SH3-like domain-containing protein n=1 Tax=Platanthera guangdongensis TaxID=2320717 RepID=A0ABR2MC07_9ASPA
MVERVGEVAYLLALSDELSGLHDMFHISVLRNSIKDPAQVIANDRVPIEFGLMTKVRPIRIGVTITHGRECGGYESTFVNAWPCLWNYPICGLTQCSTLPKQLSNIRKVDRQKAHVNVIFIHTQSR